MINIRMDLIEKELENDYLSEFKPFKLSKRFINWIFNHYYCLEMCEKFYDNEPDIADDLWDKHYAYISGDCLNEEYKVAHFEVVKRFEEYEENRIRNCIWCEPLGDGIWGYTQSQVNRVAKKALKDIRKINTSKEKRIWFAKDNEQLRIYFYGRDVYKEDVWFIFSKKKDKRKK